MFESFFGGFWLFYFVDGWLFVDFRDKPARELIVINLLTVKLIPLLFKAKKNILLTE